MRSRKVRLTLRDQSVSMDAARQIIQKILEEADELIEVSTGLWDGDFTTYVLEAPMPLSLHGLEVLLQSSHGFGSRLGKIQSLDVVSETRLRGSPE